MDNKKFEQLIDLIINENEEQARALFHDIVVEKSREIYEHLMDEDTLEENLDVEPTSSSAPPVNASGEADGLLDEIEMEEQGMNEEDDEMDLDDMDDEDTEIMDLDSDEDDMDDMDDEGSVEDRVVDIEDKVDNLERLMAEFEEIMNGGGGDEESLDGMDGMDGMGSPFGDLMSKEFCMTSDKGRLFATSSVESMDMLLARVDGGTVVNQQGGGSNVTRARDQHERSLAFGVG